LIPIELILAMDSLLAGMTLTLYASLVRCSCVKQWWACSSL